MKIIKKRAGTMNHGLVGLYFILPWFLGFLIFLLYPLVSSVYYSFTNYQVGSTPKFTGFYNYIRMFTRDPDFFNSLRITFNYSIISIVLKLALALAIAMILNLKLKLTGLYRTLFYLPSIFGGSIAIAMLWRMLFNYNGFINSILGVLAIKPIAWLTDPGITLYTISFVNVWMFGSSMILFLAALKDVPEYLYEAARIDGAGAFKRFTGITLPMITPVILFNLIMQTINAFQEFTGAFTIPNKPGDPMKSTYLFSIKIYEHAFGSYEMGYACALSIILFLVILMFTAILQISSKRWVYYAGD